MLNCRYTETEPEPDRHWTRASCLARAVGTAAAVLLTLALFAADIPIVHSHDQGAPGLYNEECPLARLATRFAGVTAAGVPETSGQLSLPDEILATAHVAPPAPPLAPRAARAPPTAPDASARLAA